MIFSISMYFGGCDEWVMCPHLNICAFMANGGILNKLSIKNQLVPDVSFRGSASG